MSAPVTTGIKKTIKVVVVGDGAVGKTCLLIQYTTKAFPQDYVPTVFDNYSCIETWGGKPINLVLWDTAGQEDYDKLRPLSYPQTDVFVLCYSVVGRDSFINVEYKWLEEIRKANPVVPFVIVGTKRDLREDRKLLQELKEEGQEPVTTAEGEALCKKLGAIGFFECSALEGKGIAEIFALCIATVMTRSPGVGSGSKKERKSSASSPSSPSSSPTLSRAGIADKKEEKGKAKVGAPATDANGKKEKKPAWGLFGKKSKDKPAASK